jgi:pimeloyl-ACP methyl ester carboxylesterase
VRNSETLPPAGLRKRDSRGECIRLGLFGPAQALLTFLKSADLFLLSARVLRTILLPLVGLQSVALNGQECYIIQSFSVNTNDSLLALARSLRTDHNPFRQRAFKHVVLMGHSFGATLARATVADFPDLADLLILTASSLGHEPTLPELGFLLTVNPGPYLTLPSE